MITPQVGQVYDTTKLWNSLAEPREIVGVLVEEGYGTHVQYVILSHGPRAVHNISLDGFNRTVKRKAWILRLPSYMRLPVGA